jgi:hypothetical protein
MMKHKTPGKAIIATHLVLASAFSFAEDHSIVGAAQPKGKFLIESKSTRDLTHGYATAVAYTDLPDGKRAKVAVAVEQCDQPKGRILLSMRHDDLDSYEWSAAGNRAVDRLAKSVCAARKG